MFREAEIFQSSSTEITFKDGRIITQKTNSEEFHSDLNKIKTGNKMRTIDQHAVVKLYYSRNQITDTDTR